MAADRIYTPTEAAAVSGMAVKAVHNAIDKKIVETKPDLRPSGAARRALTQEGLLRLKLWHGVGSALSAERREKLFEAIAAMPNAKTVRADELLIVDVGAARKQLDAQIRTLDEAEAAIHRDKGILGGEPVFRGTRIPVRMVAAMLAQGASAEEILEGYPALAPRMLELAAIWVAAHPARGRPKTLDEQGLRLKSTQRLTLKGDPRSSRSGTAA
ncbi:UNVERIFIED_ORG: uncharacterized protein (DUF433 family) [Xanthobacter viscosus]|uniref:DUF433 domain-containing protein n=1 Tax=Xanthobacter autotrophicus TaxID=280 RepID=A0A6C1KRW4_XANAU|nr:DUF433 domain-containing protein [Xanthobacter autotrophicus]TLX41323.1 DUF433 domain-containing protein [Xanthobacter autotrophicus]